MLKKPKTIETIQRNFIPLKNNPKVPIAIKHTSVIMHEIKEGCLFEDIILLRILKNQQSIK